jgi:ATP-dependent Clp protease protease subunit
MNYVYCINPDSNTPIMLINKEIGGYEGVSGSQFQNELTALDLMGKESIEIHINSTGGSIIEGFSIYSAIVNCKTPVNTVNVGLCASTASWLFLAGKKCTMMDYALLMVHNPYNANSSESEVLSLFKNSIVNMICNRTGIESNLISDMMDSETWMDSSTAKEMNLCSDIRTVKIKSKPILSKNLNAYSEAFNFVNQLIKPIPQMDYSKVCNKLGIVENSNEDSILKAIDSALDNSTKKANEFENKANLLVTENETLKAKLVEFENKAKEQNVFSAKALVEKYSNKLTAESIPVWENKAVEDFEGTEILLKSIPFNKVGVDVVEAIAEVKKELPTNAFYMLNQLNNK